jgi:hypothetical protein
MNAGTAPSAEVLIVTDSFVEAVDLTEALNPLDPKTILHLRDVQACAPFLEDPAFCPRLGLISYKRSNAEVGPLARVLVDRGSAMVLIDASPEDAEALGGVALARPYSSATLTTLFESLRQGKNRQQLAPDPA